MKNDTRDRIYQFIVDYLTDNGYSPTVREICNGVGLKSTSSGYSHLVHLHNDGKIILGNDYSPRKIKLVDFKFKLEKSEV